MENYISVYFHIVYPKQNWQ